MKMDSFKILVSVAIVCTALQHGCGQPLSERAELQAPRVRTKRCSCNSWDDKECVYFCHLDIIWVNTPSKLLPYGLGSPRRRRRSAGRCACADSSDATCGAFCLDSSRSPGVRFPAETPKVKVKVLTFLRSVVQSNMAAATAAKRLPSTNNKLFRLRRPKIRARR